MPGRSPPSRLLRLLAGLAVASQVAAVAAAAAHPAAAAAAASPQSASRDEPLCATARYQNKTRVFIMTDISNEPDDQMSLVRLLTYANELDIVALAAVTSVWKNDSIDTPAIHGVLAGYAAVRANLDAHAGPGAPAYPPAEHFSAALVTGHPVYGLAALAQPAPSNASAALVAAVDASPAPLWVCAWGGAAVLAEALLRVERARSPADLAAFVRKLRVYAISDQDDAGAWIRTRFPTLFYIVSVHGFSEYAMATWEGISGETLRHFDKGGPDSSLVTNEWLETHIRIGALGAHYLNWTYIMEGDTPSFLGLLPNGLNSPEHPEWGGWGGRYMRADASGAHGLFSDAADWVVGANDDMFFSRYASIWRWRRAYQFDFAARMRWTLGDDDADAAGAANHAPVAVVNGSCVGEGRDGALWLPYRLGAGGVVLDASASWDGDGDALAFDWFHYREPTFRLEGDIPRVSPNVTITPLDAAGAVVNVTPNDNETMHIILTVEDDREMPLVAYRRIILYPTA